MADIKLFSNSSNKTLVAGQRSTQPIEPSTLPLFCGDTLTLSLYFLQLPTGYNAQDPSNSTLQTLSTAGLTPFVVLCNGALNGTIYAQATGWAADATQSYFAGTMSLNTTPLNALVTAAGASGASVYLKIGYLQDGVPTTTFSAAVTVGVGIPVGSPVPVPGLTAASVEVSNATYLPQQPVNGMPFYLASAAGKILCFQYVDNPDGTASLQQNPIN